MTAKDPIFALITKEEQRSREMIGLIPSENHISPEVSSVLSSVLSSKYSEGMAGQRYYEGNQLIDQIEIEAADRLKKLFGVPYANVQPYSGSPANLAIYFALMEPGETLMGLKLTHGGHLTHGHPKVTFSGKFFQSVQYTLGADAKIDLENLRELAHQHQPKVIVAGTTAYPFEIDFAPYRQIADEVGAWLVADISHITGLVIGREHPSPVPHADVIMSTTHKTFRGPRGAMILVTKRGLTRDPSLPKRLESAIIPGLQGGPHNATTAAIALAAGEASRAAFKKYARQIRTNATALAQSLRQHDLEMVGSGTQNHLILLDLSRLGRGLGTQVAFALDCAGIYANRNTVPAESCSPFYPSGLRIGTPLITTRGMRAAQMAQIGDWIAQVVELVSDEQLPADKKAWAGFIKEFHTRSLSDKKLKKIKREVRDFALEFPLFTW